MLGGGLLVTLETRSRQLAVGPIVDAALGAGTGGVLLARLMYVGLHWGYYQTHISEALRPWSGGLAWQGALIGGVTGTAVVCGSRGLSLPEILDVFAPGAATVATLAWLGCHAASCAYGIATYPGQGLLWELSLDLPDLYGIREPRVAVQLLGAAWSALVLGGLLVSGRRMGFAGGAFAMWLTLQSLGAFGLGCWRADPMPQVMGWRVDQAVNLLLLGAGIIMAIAGRRKRSKHVNASSCRPSAQP